MGKYSEGIKRSEEVIIRPEEGGRLYDRKTGAMFFKANALDALGNFDEAIEYYDYVEQRRTSAGTLYYRGRSKVKNGDITNGLLDLKVAIERNYKYWKLANSDKDFESVRNDGLKITQLSTNRTDQRYAYLYSFSDYSATDIKPTTTSLHRR